jgi:hypothetical protein
MDTNHSRLRSGSDLVLKCIRIAVTPNSKTMNAAKSTSQNAVEQETQTMMLGVGCAAV